MHKKGIKLNSVEKILSHSADKIRRRTLLCFERIRNFSSKGGGGSSTLLSKFFLSHRTKKTSPGNHSVFQKFSGREKYYMDRKGGYHDFPSKIFCLTVPKYFIGEHFGVSEKFFYRKFSCIGGGITVLSELFVSQDRNEKLCKGTLMFSRKFLVSKKIYGQEGAYHDFQSEFLCLTVPKNFVGESYCFRENFWFRKVLRMKRGLSRFFVETFCSHSAGNFRGHPFNVSENLEYRKILCIIRAFTFFRQKFLFSVPKNFVGIPLKFQKNWGIEKFYA